MDLSPTFIEYTNSTGTPLTSPTLSPVVNYTKKYNYRRHGSSDESCEGLSDRVERIASFLKDKTTYRPEIGIICGSGLGKLSSILDKPIVVKYNDIPEFPISTVPGHEGELVFGMLNKATILLMKGRFHTYEGYDIQSTTLPIRVMALLGIKYLIVTNAAGSLNPEYNIGDFMFISDHVNMPGMSGKHPLVGPNDERFGERFIPMTECYDNKIRKLAYKSACSLNFEHKVHRNGIYCFVSGPTYETPSEANLLRLAGGDAVGMSTVPEVIVAVHSGIKVFGISLITNRVILPGIKGTPPSHEEVLAIVNESQKNLQPLVVTIVNDLYNYDKELDSFVDGTAHISDHCDIYTKLSKLNIYKPPLFAAVLMALAIGITVFRKQ